jgi:hypothetical protein
MKCPHQHGSPAELKPDRTILTQRVKMGGILLDPKQKNTTLKNLVAR